MQISRLTKTISSTYGAGVQDVQAACATVGMYVTCSMSCCRNRGALDVADDVGLGVLGHDVAPVQAEAPVGDQRLQPAVALHRQAPGQAHCRASEVPDTGCYEHGTLVCILEYGGPGGRQRKTFQSYPLTTQSGLLTDVCSRHVQQFIGRAHGSECTIFCI